jgi:hypothetical protein
MSPILDSIGNAKSYGWGSYIPPVASYESIATVTISGDSTQYITFDNIPQNFTHLQLRGIARNAVYQANRLDFMFLDFNDSQQSGVSFGYNILQSDVSTVSAITGANSNAYVINPADRYSGNAPLAYSVFVIDILDYKNTTKFKPLRMLNSFISNSDSQGYNYFSSSIFRTTNAISKISLYQANIVRYKDKSQIALYGIKAE